jgi:hypothetical protein
MQPAGSFGGSIQRRTPPYQTRLRVIEKRPSLASVGTRPLACRDPVVPQ